MIQEGLYEQLINKLISSKLKNLDRNDFYISETPIDKNEAASILSQYLCGVIRLALNLISGDESVEKQIELSNKVIILLRDELSKEEFDENLITTETRILSAIF